MRQTKAGHAVDYRAHIDGQRSDNFFGFLHKRQDEERERVMRMRIQKHQKNIDLGEALLEARRLGKLEVVQVFN